MTKRFSATCFQKDDKNFWAQYREDPILKPRRAIKEALRDPSPVQTMGARICSQNFTSSQK